jgi:hypothetical protein
MNGNGLDAHTWFNWMRREELVKMTKRTYSWGILAHQEALAELNDLYTESAPAFVQYLGKWEEPE